MFPQLDAVVMFLAACVLLRSLSQPQKKQSEVKEYMLMQQLMCMTQYTAVSISNDQTVFLF